MNTKSQKTVLVTGAGGYIGSVLVEQLLKRGYQVRAFDTFFWGKRPIENTSKKLEVIRGDIRSIKARVIKGADYIIHAAGLSNDPMADFNRKANFEINTKATKRFVKLCKQHSVKKFIFASSASIYDRKNGGKILQDENSKVIPIAAYSVSKHKAEKEIIKLKDKNFCPVIFRQGTVYGYSKRLRYDLVVNTMVKDALQNGIIHVFTKGAQYRPLVDVKDVAKVYILAIESDNPKICGEIFNLRYKNYTVLQLSRIIRKTLENKFKIKIKVKIENTQKVGRNYKITGDKLRAFFKWKPQIPVEESVQDLVQQIKKNKNTDFSHPRYYNIEWMKLLTEVEDLAKGSKKIF